MIILSLVFIFSSKKGGEKGVGRAGNGVKRGFTFFFFFNFGRGGGRRRGGGRGGFGLGGKGG